MAIVPPTQAVHTHTESMSTLHPEHGVHDAMRHGLRSLHDETAASAHHPLQHRLEQWDETQREWKLTMQRNTFGLGMPMRTMMERKIVSHTPHMPARRVALVHLDILDGRDETLEPYDFLPCTLVYLQSKHLRRGPRYSCGYGAPARRLVRLGAHALPWYPSGAVRARAAQDPAWYTLVHAALHLGAHT